MPVAIQGYVSTQEAAEIIGCTDARVRQLVKGRAIKGAIRVGQRMFLIPATEAERIKENPSHLGRPRTGKAG